MHTLLQRGRQSVTHGTGPSSSPTISTSTNRITALSSYSYYYDSNGSLTQDDMFKYKYDAENRLVEIRNLSNTLLSSYAYDGNSMQVIKVVGAGRWWYLYAGGQLVSEFTDAASNTYSSPTTPGSAPADSVSTVLYQHADHLTSRVTTDNTGNLSNWQAHYPYGESWYTDGTADPSVKRKFTSYRKETDSSLASGQINYAIARYHGARIGRFHMADPLRGRVGNPQRLNRYAYVVGDPANRRDPRGTDDAIDRGPVDGMDGMDMGPDPAPCGGEMCAVQDAPNMGTDADAWFPNNNSPASAVVPFLGGSLSTTEGRADQGCVWASTPSCAAAGSVSWESLGSPRQVSNTCSTCSSCVCVYQVPLLRTTMAVLVCTRTEVCRRGEIRTVSYVAFSAQTVVVGFRRITSVGRYHGGRCACEPPSV